VTLSNNEQFSDLIVDRSIRFRIAGETPSGGMTTNFPLFGKNEQLPSAVPRKQTWKAVQAVDLWLRISSIRGIIQLLKASSCGSHLCALLAAPTGTLPLSWWRGAPDLHLPLPQMRGTKPPCWPRIHSPVRDGGGLIIPGAAKKCG
jgi:hypothetical protein